MDGIAETPPSKIELNDPVIEVGLTFLQALFQEKDMILFRPIETWTEGGKKKSRVLYKSVIYRSANPMVLRMALCQQLELSEANKCNVFFGVCPRKGGNGKFDLTWQIRTVRALWTDIDHVSVAEARERIAKSGLPPPSMLVNSGNGVHVYWLLQEPFLIDDVGDPPAVENEWIKTPDGRTKPPRKYITENGEKVYLDAQRHVSRLSAKAQHVQDVLAGIANACGGDHTTDLARLLRIPGSYNRKDERSGRQPVPTELLECDPTRRYAFADFEKLAMPSAETEKAKNIATMPLPKPRKATGKKSDKLADLVAACAIAEVGRRSEADFSLCCYAIKNGIDREEVWGSAQGVGKFVDGGRRYFDTTWANAEYQVQSQKYEELQPSADSSKKRNQTPRFEPSIGDGGAEEEGCEAPEGESERPTIYIDPSNITVLDTLQRVTNALLNAKNCFLRTEQLVVINSEQISSVISAPELAGLLNQHVEFYCVTDEGGEYKPFPTNLANTWLNQRNERGRLPTIKLFTRNPVYTNDWRVIAPGFDEQSGIYYAGQAIAPLEGTKHLDDLLQEFCFKTIADRTNYLGMLLTTVLIPQFVGAKPAALFNGNQPGLGKTILAQIIATLRDGQPTETASYNANDEEFEKRLGAIVRRGTLTIIIDNAKGQGRKARIDSPCLERSITDAVLSYRLLGKSQEIRAENSHIFCITANTPDVSPDLVSRSVVINLEFEGDPKRRKFNIADPEGYAEKHRAELLGELLGMVERWKSAGMPLAKVNTRFNKRDWGNIVGGILQANGEPDFLINAEEAAAQLDDTRREFTELVEVMVEHQQGNWLAAELVTLCHTEGLLKAEIGEGTPRSLSTKMGTLAGRYVNERFGTSDGRQVLFLREDGRKGKLYRVAVVSETPNLEPNAEPLPNLIEAIGSAP